MDNLFQKNKKSSHLKNIKFIFLTNLFLILISFIHSDDVKMIIFNSQHYRAGHFAFNSEGDMIIEYSSGNYRLFYGLKKNWKYFFKDNDGNEIPTKEIQLDNNGNDAKRYESKNIFITNNNNNKQYLFSIATADSVTELHDFESGNYLIETTNNFLGNTIYSYIFSLLEFTDENQKNI